MKLNKIIILCSVSLMLLSNNAKAETEKECFEDFSRGIFKFNQGFDKAILKPIASGYNKLPEPIRTGTGNFTSNLGTLLTIPNHLLQGQWKLAGESTASFVINSTVGILGFANPAAKMGLKNQQEDVGQTLGSYGVGPGCYFVLPILGPTTARDSVGMIADSFVDPFAHITWRENELFGISGKKLDYITVKGTTAIDFRADNDLNFDSIEKNSIDLYSSFKSIYLQDRENKIKNDQRGNVEVIYKDEEDWEEIDSK